MMNKATIAAPLLLLALMAASPSPDGKAIVEHGSVEHGSTGGAPACVSCHGVHLEGNAAIKAPALAGLSRAKILERLAHYASPQGHNATMRAVASALTPADRAAVAAYIAHIHTAGPAPH